MKFILSVIVMVYVAHSKALECGFSQVNRNEIHQIINKCIGNNNNDTADYDETDVSSMEDDQSTTVEPSRIQSAGGSGNNNMKSSRQKRALNKQMSPLMLNNTDEENNNTTETDVVTTTEVVTEANNDQISEKCIVQCVLQHLNMTDDSGMPDHAKFTDGLLKNAQGRELRNFLQETTDECFQDVTNENNSDACDHSSKLITCLAERGRSNCADWPAGSLPF